MTGRAGWVGFCSWSSALTSMTGFMRVRGIPGFASAVLLPSWSISTSCEEAEQGSLRARQRQNLKNGGLILEL